MSVIEKIGGVTINDKFYSGKDIYRDGAVAEKLMVIARDNDPSTYEAILTGKKDRDVVCHFSSQRKNIISFVQIRPEEEVLEIGSGYGALSGYLADRAKELVCIEASRQRALVSAYRHRVKENITIFPANPMDVLEKTERVFDLVIIPGTLAYAKAYTRQSDAAQNFLNTALKHVKPGGRLILIEDNRTGLQSFAGKPEGHTGRIFDGIEGFPNVEKVCTFSKPALEDMIKKAGAASYKFYYPYPDRYFTTAVYSDERLPKRGELAGGFPDLFNERLVLFDEGRVYDTLIDDGLFPVFSNSFLIEIAV